MPFTVIRAEQRTASMIEWFSGMCQKITDFAVGSKFRTKFESIAVEMESQDYAFEQAVREAIPVSIYQTFGFGLIAASRAIGKATFVAITAPTNSIAIKKGTRVSTLQTTTQNKKIYEIVNDVAIAAGANEVTADIIAVETGVIGNTGPSTIITLETNISGIDYLYNLTAVTSGRDEESDDERRIRFNAYITTLSRGTGAAIEYGAKTAQLLDTNGNATEYVARTKIVEPYLADNDLPIGHIYCYIHNGAGSTTNDLVVETQKIVDGYVKSDGTIVEGYKAAGVICDILPAVEDPTEITISITAASDSTDTEKADLKTAIELAISDYVKSLDLGETLLKSKMIEIAMLTSGVYNAAVTLPATDVTALDHHIIMASSITATVA